MIVVGQFMGYDFFPFDVIKPLPVLSFHQQQRTRIDNTTHPGGFTRCQQRRIGLHIQHHDADFAHTIERGSLLCNLGMFLQKRLDIQIGALFAAHNPGENIGGFFLTESFEIVVVFEQPFRQFLGTGELDIFVRENRWSRTEINPGILHHRIDIFPPSKSVLTPGKFNANISEYHQNHRRSAQQDFLDRSSSPSRNFHPQINPSNYIPTSPFLQILENRHVRRREFDVFFIENGGLQ